MDGLTQLFSGLGGGGGGGVQPTPGFGGAMPPVFGQSQGAPLWEKLVTGGMLGMGELGNILEENKRSKYQDVIMNYLKHPELMAAAINKLTQGISPALKQSVMNMVQGQMAERGLAQAPGIFAATSEQALAPYALQQQQLAQQQFLATLGIPSGQSFFQQPQNLSPLMGQFMQMLRPPQQFNQQQPGLTFPDVSDPNLGLAIPGAQENPAAPGQAPGWFGG